MDRAMVTALVSNVAILLALCVVGDAACLMMHRRPRLQPVLSGLMVAGLCLAAINAPLLLPSGILLDTRSILISVTALVFGPVSTGIAAVTAAAFVVRIGGAGTPQGLAVILISALIGLVWRRWVYPKAGKRRWVSILAMGVAVHGVALAVMLLTPYPQNMAVFRGGALPVLLAFPTATLLLCLLLYGRQAYQAEHERLERTEVQHAKADQSDPLPFQQMPDAFALHEIICDAQGKPMDYRYLSVNAAFEKMTGLTRAEILGKTGREVLPDMEAGWIETCAKAAFTGEPTRVAHYASSTGQHFDVCAYQTAPGQFACTFSDISNRVRAQEETNRILLRLQCLLDNSPSPIVIMDEKGRIIEVSTVARRILGLPREDRATQETARVAPPEIIEKVLHVLSQSTDAIPMLESIDVFEYDGSKRYFESRLFPIHTPSQGEKLFGYLAIDVTERIEVEQALKASKEKYSNYIENAPYAVFVVDEHGHCLEANRAATAITGYSKEKLLGMSARDITTPASAEANAHKWKELQTTGHISVELTYVHESGLTRWWTVDAVKLPENRFLCFAGDTTAKNRRKPSCCT